MLLACEDPRQGAGIGCGWRHSLAGLTEEARSKALERYEVLRPALEDGVSLAEAARVAGVPSRSAQRWMATYRSESLAGLAPHPRGDRGHCHGLSRELEGVIEGLALKKPRLSTAQTDP